MFTADTAPRWLTRWAHSVASCLVGLVGGTAMFARSHFEHSVALGATILAVMYAIVLVIAICRHLATSSKGARASGA